MEERLARLEAFIGNITKIMSVYGNTLEEICNKYMNLMYIESIPTTHADNILYVDGFLGDITSSSTVPKNVILTIIPSHNYTVVTGESAKIQLKNGDTTLLLTLQKLNSSGSLVDLSADDYMNNKICRLYVNAQGIAVLYLDDSGTSALSEVTRITTGAATETLAALRQSITALSTALTTATLTATNATVSGSLTLTGTLTSSNPLALPTNSTVSGTELALTDDSTKIATTEWVTDKITKVIDDRFLIGTGDPTTELAGKDKGTFYFKHS